MKVLKEKLHKAIDEYGIGDKRTIAISQELDELVCKKQTILFRKYKQERNVY